MTRKSWSNSVSIKGTQCVWLPIYLDSSGPFTDVLQVTFTSGIVATLPHKLTSYQMKCLSCSFFKVFIQRYRTNWHILSNEVAWVVLSLRCSFNVTAQIDMSYQMKWPELFFLLPRLWSNFPPSHWMECLSCSFFSRANHHFSRHFTEWGVWFPIFFSWYLSKVPPLLTNDD